MSSLFSLFTRNTNNNRNNNNNVTTLVPTFDEEVPHAFLCPITCELMHDPVIDREGNSYDRKAILDWLRKGNDTSPMTRLPLKEDDLTPNRALKDQIESFKIAKAQESMKKSEKEDDKSHTGTSYVILPGNGVDTKLDISLSLHNAAAIDGISSLETETDLLCLATIKGPKEEQKRAPVDICCVIDVSGSMGNTATIKNANGNTESNGLTILDIVKHGVT